MHNTTIVTNPEHFIFSSNNALKTTSFKVAEAFGKFHKNIIQKIETLECSEDFRQLNFQPTQIETIMPTGGIRKDPAYEITKNGFMFFSNGIYWKKSSSD